jgi:hypothetical protein
MKVNDSAVAETDVPQLVSTALTFPVKETGKGECHCDWCGRISYKGERIPELQHFAACPWFRFAQIAKALPPFTRHELLLLLDEARDAIQALTVVQVRLHNISPTLAKRIDDVIDKANAARVECIRG